MKPDCMHSCWNNLSIFFFLALCVTVLNERSTSDDENFNNESSPEEDEDDMEEACGVDISSDECEYSSENSSDAEDKFLDVSNKSAASVSSTESENTTHSYSNSLLEEEDDEDADEIPSIQTKEYSAPDLSDLSNGKIYD